VEGAGRSSLSLGCVLRQTRITFQYSQGVVVHIVSGHIGLAEDLLEVLVSHRSEVLAIFRCNAQYHGVGGQRFAMPFAMSSDSSFIMPFMAIHDLPP
jgi:hypothetical protein